MGDNVIIQIQSYMDINLEQRSNTKALSSWNNTYFSTKDNAIHISFTSEAASHNAIYSSHLNPQPFEIMLSITRQKRLLWLIGLLLINKVEDSS